MPSRAGNSKESLALIRAALAAAGMQVQQRMRFKPLQNRAPAKPAVARRAVFIPVLLAAVRLSGAGSDAPLQAETTEPLRLGVLRSLVRQNSETVQMAMLQAEVDRRLAGNGG